MESQKELFQKKISDAFNSLPQINSKTMLDSVKYQGMVKEFDELEEKWSEKYKKSIDCKNPKGFSQKAHCQGKKKKEVGEEKLKGGKADNKTFQDLVNKYKQKGKDSTSIEKQLKNQLNKGMKVEMEHTKDKAKAKEIAMDHLFEDPKYYDKLQKIENKEATSTGSSGQFSGPFAFKDSEFVRKSFAETPKKVETKEATGSGSVGAYSTPAFVAPNKKQWRGAAKPLYKGGAFVKVKKKCKNFPYCNQGDIKALNIFKEESVQEAIKAVSEKLNLSENVIMAILDYEYEKLGKERYL
jgi:hypothetical protein